VLMKTCARMPVPVPPKAKQRLRAVNRGKRCPKRKIGLPPAESPSGDRCGARGTAANRLEIYTPDVFITGSFRLLVYSSSPLFAALEAYLW
jgi:hypothetical protein